MPGLLVSISGSGFLSKYDLTKSRALESARASVSIFDKNPSLNKF